MSSRNSGANGSPLTGLASDGSTGGGPVQQRGRSRAAVSRHNSRDPPAPHKGPVKPEVRRVGASLSGRALSRSPQVDRRSPLPPALVKPDRAGSGRRSSSLSRDSRSRSRSRSRSNSPAPVASRRSNAGRIAVPAGSSPLVGGLNVPSSPLPPLARSGTGSGRNSPAGFAPNPGAIGKMAYAVTPGGVIAVPPL